jgi:hypothetical protein
MYSKASIRTVLSIGVATTVATETEATIRAANHPLGVKGTPNI